MYMYGLRTETQDTKLLGIHVVINKRNIFFSPTEYCLKNASFWLHPVQGTHPAEPAVTMAEVLPLCPSRINGNVGHKQKSQAYNGEEKAHMEKECICDRQDAMRVIIFSLRIGSPQVWFTHVVRPE